MTDKLREAAQLALEALEQANSAMARCMGNHASDDGDRHRALANNRATITTLRAALAEQAQRALLTDDELLERLASASPEQLDAWLAAARQSEARKQRVMLTDEETRDIHWSKPMDEYAYARAVIEAYEIKNGTNHG